MKFKKALKHEINRDLTAGALLTGYTIGATERKIGRFFKRGKK